MLMVGVQIFHMVSGINRLPQANVMSLLSKRRYTYNSIVNSLTTSHSSDIPSNDLRSTSLEDINLSDTCLLLVAVNQSRIISTILNSGC